MASTLLFFDTFSHEVSDEVQLDLVQFPKAVQVTEVRAIPLGARVQADFPGGVRLGATNPSQFGVEFFVNDLSKRGAATFESVGSLQYNQHGNIQLLFEKKHPTDGLLLRGNYNTITLAVYGNLTKVQREPSPPKVTKRTEAVVPHPPPEKVNTHDRIRDWLEETQECRKQQAPFAIDPAVEEQPDWDPKPPQSPIEYEEPKVVWEEEALDSSREFERERERESVQSVRGEEVRERERERSRSRKSVDRSGSRDREKSWERTERSSSRRGESKRENVRERDRESRHERDRDKDSDRDFEKDRDRDYEREREREREREKEREREREREKEREKEKQKQREREREREREERERDRERERERGERDRERDRDRDRDRERDRDRDRNRDRDRDRERDRDRDKDRDRDRDRDSNRDRDRSRGRDRDRERERERDRSRDLERERESHHTRESRDRYDDDRISTQQEPPTSSRGRRSIEGDTYSEDGNASGIGVVSGSGTGNVVVSTASATTDKNSRDYRDPRGMEGGHDKYDASASDYGVSGPECGPGGMLLPLPVDDCEAISDDEDLPEMGGEPPEAMQHHAGPAYIQDTSGTEQDALDTTPQDEGVEEGLGFGEFEEIMSDEEELPEYEEEWLVEEWEDWLKSFTPDEFQMMPLKQLVSPTVSAYDLELFMCSNHLAELKQEMEEDGENIEDEPPQVVKFCELLISTSVPTLLDSDVNVEVEESVDAEVGETWVTAVEELLRYMPKALPYVVARDGIGVVDQLCEWINIGLNFDMALGQQQPVYKIRHMKAGIRLCMSLLQSSSDVSHRLLLNDVVDKLFMLYHKPHMALSIKLLIIKCLDCITHSSLGLQYFLGRSNIEEENKMETEEDESKRSPYERILQMLSENQPTRAKLALTCIVRKIHLLDTCEALNQDTKAILDLLPELPEDIKLSFKKDEIDDIMDVDELEGRCAIPSEWGKTVGKEQIVAMTSYIQEINRYLKYAPQLIAQPHRWFPGSKQFQLPKNPVDPYPQLYIIFDQANLLKSLAAILSGVGTVGGGSLVGGVRVLLLSLLSHSHGLRYLAAHPQTTTIIIRSLMQVGFNWLPQPTPVKKFDRLPYFQLCEDSSSEDGESQLHQLGLYMLHVFYAMHHLDALSHLQDHLSAGAAANVDYSQATQHFNACTSLLLTHHGRQALIAVLSSGCNLEILFTYLKLGEGDDQDNAPTRLACYGYAVELLVLTVRYAENTEMLEKYADKIYELIKYEESRDGNNVDEHARLCEILPWITIARVPENFSYDNLPVLTSNLGNNLDKIDKFSGEILTTLRILKHLTIPKYSVSALAAEEHNGELIEELKYKYASVQLFSADCHTHLTNLLTKLAAMYQQPHVHGTNFIGSEGAMVLAVIGPTLDLLKNILTYVIQAANTNFKDLTAVVPLVQTYLLLQAFPQSSPYASRAAELQQEVIAILLVYTQPVYNSSQEGEQVLSKSLWMQMCSEIFKYLLSTPATFLGTISLVIELLPLPLPLQSRTVLTQEETTQACVVRKLWSAHLHSLSGLIHDIILRLGVASFPPLMHLLRRMCVALSDLAAPMALLVARSTLDLALHTLKLDQRGAAQCENLGPCSQQSARVLNMLALLVSHAPSKAAIMHLLRGGSPLLGATTASTPSSTSSKGPQEEKYQGLLNMWCQILTTAHPNNHAHLQAQECLVNIIQYLCDHENALHLTQEQASETGLTSTSGSNSGSNSACQPQSVTQSSNSNDTSNESSEVKTNPSSNLSGVPIKEMLIPIIEALVEHLRNPQSPHYSIQQALRAIMRIMEHDYGFYHVKSVFEKKKGCLLTLFQRINISFVKESSHCIATLQGSLELCHLLLNLEHPSRSLSITPQELASYLGWKKIESQISKIEKKDADSVKKEQEKEDEQTKQEPDEEEMDKTEEKMEVDIKSEDTATKEEKPTEVETPSTHPLRLLEIKVVCDGSEDETSEALYDQISKLCALLEQNAPVEAKEVVEPVGPQVESLQSLFASRVVWTMAGEDDDIPAYWPIPPHVDDYHDSQMVPVNLLEICRLHAGDYDLLSTLHKLVRGQGAQSLTPQKMCKMTPRFKGVSPGSMRPDRRGRGFIAPMRGRVYTRGQNLRSDLFRSRPPNTSRPPSLHVDDFLALETTGHQPTGPTGYNKISFGRGRFMLDGMRGGRGRGRGDMRGGRFFHRPPFRPDGMRGIQRGFIPRGRPFVFRGDSSPRGNYRMPMRPDAPMRFMRGRGRGEWRGGDRGRGEWRDQRRGRGEMNGGRHMRGFR